MRYTFHWKPIGRCVILLDTFLCRLNLAPRHAQGALAQARSAFEKLATVDDARIAFYMIKAQKKIYISPIAWLSVVSRVLKYQIIDIKIIPEAHSLVSSPADGRVPYLNFSSFLRS